MTPARNNRLVYAVTLGLLAALGPLCIDLYLPALPELARDLHTPTATAQLSLTAGLLGLGAGQLLFGPMSDKFGRLRPLTLSLALLFIASIGCALAQNIHQLLVARLFEGVAGAGGAVLSRAVARDMYSGHELTRFFALLMLVNGLAPIGAPVLGGVLMTLLNWRGIFMVLGATALLLILLARWKLHETLPPERRSQGSLFSAWAALGQVVVHRPFMGFCLTQAFMMSGMFAYIGASPFVLQQIYGLSPQAFSFCFAANGIGLVIASQASARLCPLWGEYPVLKGGLTLAFAASSLLLLTGLLAAPAAGAGGALFHHREQRRYRHHRLVAGDAEPGPSRRQRVGGDRRLHVLIRRGCGADYRPGRHLAAEHDRHYLRLLYAGDSDVYLTGAETCAAGVN